MEQHMFNHHCINLKGDVEVRALSWEVAFYGTTLLLLLAHLLQSLYSKLIAAKLRKQRFIT